MGTINDDFDIESTVDLDNVDEAAAKALEDRVFVGKDEIEVEQVPDKEVQAKPKEVPPQPESLEPTEEELAAYSEKVRERFGKITHARHEERREKETAQRERDEAVQFAQQVLARQRVLEAQAAELLKTSHTATAEKIDADLAAARAAYVEAANSYDTEAMAEANMKMSALAAKKERLEEKKALQTPLQAPETRVQTQPTARPAPDQRAKEWAARNDAWFQKDKAMTAFAFGVHEELVGKGVDPRTDSELYYKKLDEEVKSRFPEKFESAPATRTSRTTSPVAPASRVVNGRRKVTLSASEMALARRLNVTPEQFAAEKIKLENRNG